MRRFLVETPREFWQTYGGKRFTGGIFWAPDPDKDECSAVDARMIHYGTSGSCSSKVFFCSTLPDQKSIVNMFEVYFFSRWPSKIWVVDNQFYNVNSSKLPPWNQWPEVQKHLTNIATFSTLLDFFLAPMIGSFMDSVGRLPTMMLAMGTSSLLRLCLAAAPSLKLYMSLSCDSMNPQRYVFLSFKRLLLLKTQVQPGQMVGAFG